jgi:hypothetical protein
LKRYHLSGTNQPPEEMGQAQAGARIVHTERHFFFNFNCNWKNFFSGGRVYRYGG